MSTRQSERGASARLTRAFRPRRNRILTAFAATAVLLGGTVVSQSAMAAPSTDYPSWSQVQSARANTAAKAKEVASLTALIASLQANVASTQADADAKGALAQQAQLKYDTASQKAVDLKGQADVAQSKADKSKREAGLLAARLAQSGGGGDLSTTIFFSGSKTDDLLSQLGLANMVKDQSAGLYKKATQDQNTAQSLTDQANVAKDALKQLNDAAQTALAAAAAAETTALAALAEQQSHVATLQAQLATLKTDQQHTEAEYTAGVVASYGAGASVGTGAISSDGYTRPTSGHMSSPYGMRLDPYYNRYQLHDGTDLAPSCGTPIYAAHSGTVVYAGPYGGYGNYIKISDGDGISTAYGHIVNGGIMVAVGQGVGVGQNIARVGSTGASTGCHLHFSVFSGSTTIDPVPFMRSHGVELAN
jgi:murein DD-endopeptidase MepM/ murein hydrolase activator NlpD